MDTLFHDELRYGCAWAPPSAQCPLDHRPRDTHRSARQVNIGAKISKNRCAAVTQLTGTRPPNRFSTSAFRMRLGHYGRYRQRYPLQA